MLSIFALRSSFQAQNSTAAGWTDAAACAGMRALTSWDLQWLRVFRVSLCVCRWHKRRECRQGRSRSKESKTDGGVLDDLVRNLEWSQSCRATLVVFGIVKRRRGRTARQWIHKAAGSEAAA